MVSKMQWLYRQLNNYLIAVLGILINAVGRARRTDGKPSGHVVVVKLDHLGDLVLATPVLQWVRTRADHLSLVVGAWNIPIASQIVQADAVVAYSPQLFSRQKIIAGPDMPGLWRVLVALWDSDCIYVLRGTVFIYMVCLLLSAWKTVGVRERYRLKARVASGTPIDHEVNQMAEVVGAPWVDLDSPPLAGSHRTSTTGRPTAIVNFGAASPLRVWSSDGWAVVVQELRTLGFKLAAFGQPDDYYDLSLVELCDTNQIGQVALRDLSKEVSRASLMVGSDGGLAHLAGALGVPTVVLYGPTSPVLYRPLGAVRVIYDSFSCSPCSGVRCVMKNAEGRCMNVLSADRVVAAIHDVLRVGDPAKIEQTERMH